MLHVMNIGNEPPACWQVCHSRRGTNVKGDVDKAINAAASPPSDAHVSDSSQ